MVAAHAQIPGVPLGARSRTGGVARGISFLLPLLTLAACFDVKQVDPGPANFLIDDFEDGDTLPSTPLFRRWWCITFNPSVGQDPEQNVTCDLEAPGYLSGRGLVATFTLHDPPNGIQEFGGAGVLTTADKPVDLTGYDRLVFTLKAEFHDTGPMTTMMALFNCSTVLAERPKQTGEYFQLAKVFLATPDWGTFSLPLASFTQPDWQLNRFMMGPSSCLGAVDSIHIDVGASLLDGQSGSGVIHVDDVYLE